MNWTPIPPALQRLTTATPTWSLDAVSCFKTDRDCLNCALSRPPLDFGWHKIKQCHVPYTVQALLDAATPIPSKLYEGRWWNLAKKELGA